MYIYLILIKYVLHNLSLLHIINIKLFLQIIYYIYILYIIIYITYYVKNVVNKGDYYYLSILNIHIPYHYIHYILIKVGIHTAEK